MRLFKKPWTLSFVLTSFLLASLVLMAVAMLVIGSWGWRQNSLSSAIDITHKNAKLTELELKNLIEPVASAINLISEYPISNKNLGQDYQYLPIMLHELQSNALVSAIFIGFSNGGFISIRSLQNQEYKAKINAPENASYLLRIIRHANDSNPQAFFYSDNNELIEIRQDIDYKLQTLDRPWYKSAIAKPGLNISEPYVFFPPSKLA